MHLLVIGDTGHYVRNGEIVGWGPTVKEIGWLARAFDRVTHVALMRQGSAPQSALPYDADVARKVRLVLVPPSGGLTLRDKSRVILNAPQYVRAILSSLPEADVVHIRCPGSLGIYGVVLVSLLSRKMRWAKYGGNWVETGRLPLSFVFQRWWLRRGLIGGPVTVNGRWPDQPGHVFSFDNPSMTLDDICHNRDLAYAKVFERPICLAFVGRIVSAKGLRVVLEIVRQLLSYDVSLDILGDGPERAHFERLSEQMGLGDNVRFHGWVSHERVRDTLHRSHFVLLPSKYSEGWPKVLSEAMAQGVVPIASQVSAIPQTLADVGSGVALPADDVAGFAQAIRAIVEDPPRWVEMIRAGLDAAPRFSYERHLVRLDDMFSTFYGSSPLDGRVLGAIRERLHAIASEQA